MAESTAPVTPPISAHDRAVAYLANERFHQRFTLPATDDHAALVVSYADTGHDVGSDDPKAVPTMLYIPGMFSSRFFGVYPLHALGQKLGVRVLAIDRPGMGQSTNVPLSQRLAVWLETVPALLRHLGIDHVALVAHSAGTIYLLNVLYHFRDILSPTNPFVALLAPFVHPAHSRVVSLQMARCIPTQAFGAWHHIPRLITTKAQPAFASSGAIFTKATSAVFGRTDSSNNQDHPKSLRLEKKYGMARDLQAELDQLISKAMFDEQTAGADSEALQCLKKGPSGTWGKCDDYASFVRDLADLERNRGLGDGRPRLKVRTYFAETDAMIGQRGQLYMEECWAGNHGEFEDYLDFAAESIKKTDHDTLARALKVLEAIFHDAGGTRIRNSSATLVEEGI